jgi:hypothetical protein
MAKHVIFLVHGVGKQDPDTWSDSVQAQIRALYSAYDIAKTCPFDDFFEFQPVSYDDRFEKIRKRWRNDSSAVLGELKKQGLDSGALKAATNLAGAPAGDDVFGAFAMDVVFYKFLPPVAEAIRTQVASTLLKRVFDTDSGEIRDWSIVAHSLGTAVTHDTLHALYTSKVQGKTFAGLTKARVLMMLANVSRLLEEDDVDVYRSQCRPGAGAAEGVCRYFINAIHEWDPIPSPKQFRPLDDWPTLKARQQGRFIPVSINAFQQKNIHAFTHYLANPRVHVPFFQRLFQFDTPEQVISESEALKVRMHFEASTPFGAFEKLQKSLKGLQLTESATWKQVITTYNGFSETLKEF